MIVFSEIVIYELKYRGVKEVFIYGMEWKYILFIKQFRIDRCYDRFFDFGSFFS